MPSKMMNQLRREQGKIPKLMKNMYYNSPTSLIHKDLTHKMKLENDYQYLIKGVGETSCKVGFQIWKMKFSPYQEHIYKFVFVYGQIIVWKKGKNIDDVVMIGVEEEGTLKFSNSTQYQVNYGI